MGAVLLGVLINKASIPSARVVFSEACLLTSRNGEPVLILRIGNTRGNFLLNPEIRVGYLKVPLFVTLSCTLHASTQFTVMAPAAPLHPPSVLTHGYTTIMLNEEGHRCYLGA